MTIMRSNLKRDKTLNTSNISNVLQQNGGETTRKNEFTRVLKVDIITL